MSAAMLAFLAKDKMSRCVQPKPWPQGPTSPGSPSCCKISANELNAYVLQAPVLEWRLRHLAGMAGFLFREAIGVAWQTDLNP